MRVRNSYEDARRAEAYAKLEFPGTYYLAYRDLPGIIALHVKGSRALDFGCGTGRSTRFLQSLGFRTIGVDVSEEMMKLAREKDPEGEYIRIEDGNLSQLEPDVFDLVLSAFTFDNIPGMERKVKRFGELGRLLKSDGKIINLVSSPDIYVNEWASFSTRLWPENRLARCGDKVRIIITDTEDPRPVEDVLWPDEDYRRVYTGAGLELMETHKPLARPEEPYPWVNETRIAPWVIYLLKRSA